MEKNRTDMPIAIACRLDKDVAIKAAMKIIDYLTQNGKKIILESRIATRFKQYMARKELSAMDENSVQMILTIGGDGTVLRVAQNLPRKNPAPILGINLGSVGFLHEVDYDEDSIYRILDEIMKGEYYLERTMRLTAVYPRSRIFDALNEVYIVSTKPSKVLHVEIRVDGALLSNGYVDGVIIATGVGSTAYCLSAGGCMVDPRVKAMQIVPVNPFIGTGSLKPIVVPSTSEVRIKLLRHKLPALLVLDGQTELKISPSTEIIVKKSDSDLKFVRFHRDFYESFYNRLRTKLLGGKLIPSEDSPYE